MKIIEEWRVTGDPSTVVLDYFGEPFALNFPKYSYVWYSDRRYDARSRPIQPDGTSPLSFTAEEAAKHFARIAKDWKDGPHLHKRIVTYTDWESYDD